MADELPTSQTAHTTLIEHTIHKLHHDFKCKNTKCIFKTQCNLQSQGNCDVILGLILESVA